MNGRGEGVWGHAYAILSGATLTRLSGATLTRLSNGDTDCSFLAGYLRWDDGRRLL